MVLKGEKKHWETGTVEEGEKQCQWKTSTEESVLVEMPAAQHCWLVNVRHCDAGQAFFFFSCEQQLDRKLPEWHPLDLAILHPPFMEKAWITERSVVWSHVQEQRLIFACLSATRSTMAKEFSQSMSTNLYVLSLKMTHRRKEYTQQVRSQCFQYSALPQQKETVLALTIGLVLYMDQFIYVS